MSNQWGQLPRLLSPVQCGKCLESWFVRARAECDPEFWPRFCCYCGMEFRFATEDRPDGTSSPPIGLNGQPLKDMP